MRYAWHDLIAPHIGRAWCRTFGHKWQPVGPGVEVCERDTCRGYEDSIRTFDTAAW